MRINHKLFKIVNCVHYLIYFFGELNLMANFAIVFHGIRFKVKRLFVVMTSNFFFEQFPLYSIMTSSKSKNTYHTLSNGLRLVHRFTNSPVEYCGLAVRVGKPQ